MNPYPDRFFPRISLSVNEPLPGQVFPEDLPKLVLVRRRVPLCVPQMFRHEILNATHNVLIRRLWEKQEYVGDKRTT